MKVDAITLKEHSSNSEAGMIVFSKQLDRQPRTDHSEWQIAAMQRREARETIVWKSPDRTPQPAGTSWCASCSYINDWINVNNFYRSGGVLDHYCKDCRKAMSSGTYFRHQAEIETKRRARREAKAKAEGRVLRPYFKDKSLAKTG